MPSDLYLPAYIYAKTIDHIMTEDIQVSNIAEEINKRRTFAIISHPDAGTTTLTEKFLL